MPDLSSPAPTWRQTLDRAGFHLRRLLKRIQPAQGPGMGAIPHPEGTTFRVWAPHADRVFVIGNFNEWSPWRTPLAAEANGCWSTEVADAAAGDHYKFLIHHREQRLIRTDPYAKDIDGPHRDGLICLPLTTPAGTETATETAFVPPAANNLIIYELHVGTFNTKPDRVGTFADAITKLPYLSQLGVNAIELMPVMAFPGDYSWGYNPCQPFAIAKVYGGREALKTLVDAAHAHGIAVIVDVVYNHFGPQDLDMWQFDGWQEHGLGGLYFYNDWRSKTPWADTRPDYGRAMVRQFIRDNVLMWFEEFGVDGLRWDATSYIRNAHGHDGDPGADIAEGWSLMQDCNAAVKEIYPRSLNIAEDLQNNPWLVKDQAEGGAGFDSQWDAGFFQPVRHAIINPFDEERDMAAVAQAITGRYGDDAFSRVIYTESHDEVANGKARVPEEISPGEADNFFARKRTGLGAVLVFTAPGIPMLFQGQEFLESGWFDDHVPLDWQKVERHAPTLKLYQDLIRLRRNSDDVSAGLQGQHVNVHHLNSEARLIAFHRWQNGGPGDDVIIILNFSHQPHPSYTIGLPHPGLWRVRLNSDARLYGPDFSNQYCPDILAAPVPTQSGPIDDMPCFGNVGLGPYAALILSQDPPPTPE